MFFLKCPGQCGVFKILALSSKENRPGSDPGQTSLGFYFALFCAIIPIMKSY